MEVRNLRKIIFICLVAIVNLTILNAAEESKEIQIKVLSEDNYFASDLEVQLEVKFNNPVIYNDKVYLAYHIYDENNKELVWEGERTPLLVDENFAATVDLNIDLSKYIDTTAHRVAYIKFDMIDELNLYWLSTNEVVKADLPTIKYEENKLKQYTSIYTTAISKTPITFFVNFIVFLLAVYSIFRMIKKKRKLNKLIL